MKCNTYMNTITTSISTTTSSSSSTSSYSPCVNNKMESQFRMKYSFLLLWSSSLMTLSYILLLLPTSHAFSSSTILPSLASIRADLGSCSIGTATTTATTAATTNNNSGLHMPMTCSMDTLLSQQSSLPSSLQPSLQPSSSTVSDSLHGLQSNYNHYHHRNNLNTYAYIISNSPHRIRIQNSSSSTFTSTCRYGGRGTSYNGYTSGSTSGTSSSSTSSSTTSIIPNGRFMKKEYSFGKQGVTTLGFDISHGSSSSSSSTTSTQLSSTSSSSETNTNINHRNTNILQQQQQQQQQRRSISSRPSPIKKQMVSNLLAQQQQQYQQLQQRQQEGLLSNSNPTSPTSNTLGFHEDIPAVQQAKHIKSSFPSNGYSPFPTTASTASSTASNLASLSTMLPTTSSGISSSSSSTTTTTPSSTNQPNKGGANKYEGNGTSNPTPWLPYLPTRNQIESLKVVQLKSACLDRGLIQTGNKAELQKRLLQWAQEQHHRRILERNYAMLSSYDNGLFEQSFTNYQEKSSIRHDDDDDNDDKGSKNNTAQATFTQDNDMMMTTTRQDIKDDEIDTIVEPLINRRKALLQSKSISQMKRKQTKGKSTLGFEMNIETPSIDPNNNPSNSMEEDDDDDDDEELDIDAEAPTQQYLSSLMKSLRNDVTSPTTISNNYQIRQLYFKAKHADQAGDVEKARGYLHQLREITPNDTRIIRRLARLEMQQGNLHKSREILQSALRTLPNDTHILHGLGKLELESGNDEGARRYFRDVIRISPNFPNAYHALGTLEHSKGNIRVATTVLRMGVKNCPDNHRLYHALGELYRGAKMLDLAENMYRKGLDCIEVSESKDVTGRTNWGRSFLYTALGYLEYERGDSVKCKRWLRTSVNYDNVMHSQGWLALAQLEESEENISEARMIYKEATTKYARKRGLNRRQNGIVKAANIGDKWYNVYQSWARLEENYGNYNDANNVYSRAAMAFPNQWKNLLNWAQLQARHGRYGRARTLFELACDKAGSSDAEPYRLYAEFEMSLDNHSRARSILYLGAQSLSESADGAMGQSSGFALLFHSWAVCEWTLGNLDRAEVLFDHALRLTASGETGSEIRSLIMLSIARFLYHARKDYNLAQHCVCLSLTESIIPGGSSSIWLLWADIANAMNNEYLSKQCMDQAEKVSIAEEESCDISRLLEAMPSVSGIAMNNLLRKSPWHQKIFQTQQSCWYDHIVFPDDFTHSEHRKKKKNQDKISKGIIHQ